MRTTVKQKNSLLARLQTLDIKQSPGEARPSDPSVRRLRIPVAQFYVNVGDAPDIESLNQHFLFET